MQAARDQENLHHGHQSIAAAKSHHQNTRGLQPKTPANKFPKTPLKIPLNDENVPIGLQIKPLKCMGSENIVAGGRKSVNSDKNAFVTPIGPRNRAPLGVKTTNAKTRVFQTPAGSLLEKEVNKIQTKPRSTRKARKIIPAPTSKLDIHGDESPLIEEEVEYCPPTPRDLPYNSEDFPDNCLNYAYIKPQNLVKGLQKTYHHQRLDEDGISEQDRCYKEAYQENFKEADKMIAKMMEEEWTIGDVPETFRHLRKKQLVEQKSSLSSQRKSQRNVSSRGLPTIVSRKAASALSVVSSSASQCDHVSKHVPKVSLVSRPKGTLRHRNSGDIVVEHHISASAVSKSTIGYTKGRVLPSILQKPGQGILDRSVNSISHGFDATLTQARFVSKQEWRNPSFMKAFEVDDEDLEPGLRGLLPKCLRRADDDEDFVITLAPTDQKE